MDGFIAGSVGAKTFAQNDIDTLHFYMVQRERILPSYKLS
tara:strand:+ start:1447 stop:1566 length:120 start_codon:yes stop_codon:yes gene_type:complete